MSGYDRRRHPCQSDDTIRRRRCCRAKGGRRETAFGQDRPSRRWLLPDESVLSARHRPMRQGHRSRLPSTSTAPTRARAPEARLLSLHASQRRNAWPRRAAPCPRTCAPPDQSPGKSPSLCLDRELSRRSARFNRLRGLATRQIAVPRGFLACPMKSGAGTMR
jgi:hypothetical protein